MPEAEKHALEAIGLARRVGDEHAEVNAQTNLVVALANRGIVPDRDAVRRTVTSALAIGAADEAYRATVNFLWSAQGYLPREELEPAIDS